MGGGGGEWGGGGGVGVGGGRGYADERCKRVCTERVLHEQFGDTGSLTRWRKQD